MATVPEMRTWVDDELVTPQMLNEQIRDAMNFIMSPPQCTMKQDQTVYTTENSLQILKYNSATGSGDPQTDTINGIVTIQTAGAYSLKAAMTLNDVETLRVLFQIESLTTGEVYARQDITSFGQRLGLTIAVDADLAVGDELVVKYYISPPGANQGANGPFIDGTVAPSSFSALWIGKGTA